MTSNVAPIDQAARVTIGFLVLASPLLNLHTYPFNLLGLVPLVTGVFGYCPLYSAIRALFPSHRLAASKR